MFNISSLTFLFYLCCQAYGFFYLKHATVVAVTHLAVILDIAGCTQSLLSSIPVPHCGSQNETKYAYWTAVYTKQTNK